jgi:hypothetical protein
MSADVERISRIRPHPRMMLLHTRCCSACVYILRQQRMSCACAASSKRPRTLSAYVSIRQHTSAYVSIRQHTSACGCAAKQQAAADAVSIRQHTSAYVSIRQHTSACGCTAKQQVAADAEQRIYTQMRCAYTSRSESGRGGGLSIRAAYGQHTSAYVSIRAAYVSIPEGQKSGRGGGLAELLLGEAYVSIRIRIRQHTSAYEAIKYL